MTNRLYRSRTNLMIAGVCGGLGEYLGIDPTFVRIFFVLLTLTNGIGILIYLLLWVIVPSEDLKRNATLADIARSSANEIVSHAQAIGEDLRRSIQQPNPQAVLYLGGGLILLGVYYLLQNLRLSWLRWLNSEVLWPILIIFAGILLLRRKWKGYK